MLPEHVLHEHDTIREAMAAIAGLPPARRAVITMRNVQGCDGDEVCAALDLSEGNQPAVLQRARSCAPRSKGTSMAESHDRVSCTEQVELVTDYLERSLPPDERRWSSSTWTATRAACGTSIRSGPRSRRSAGSSPRKCRPRCESGCSSRSATGHGRCRTASLNAEA